MERRNFIKQSSLASGLLFVPNFLRSFESVSPELLSNRKLVVIQLSGGNDGLNTIVPYTNDIYYQSRPKLSIPSSRLLKLTDDLGFNSALKPLKQLYNEGYLSIINNVGFPNPVRSHFRASDIWHTASSREEKLNTGWLGRYIENYGEMPYSGIEIDDSLSLILKGNSMNGIATKNPAVLFKNMNTPYFDKVLNSQTSQHLSEHNLGYLYKTMIEAKSSAKYIFDQTKIYSSSVEYQNNPFAKQLKTTAQFINSGIKSQVFYVSMGGFDTHANQINRQEKLLEIYAQAMSTFISDLEEKDTFKDTLILTFSEFGRRLEQNAAAGTDHGAANNVFVLGKNLKVPGFYNDGPNLENLDKNRDIKFTIDFREIYATILQKWLRVDQETILGSSFNVLNFI
ncbi:DUF1501 domain-containing protein [uncultured Aquimarina sp.]|uniref:DUF1501 domain-containing protein n=1 Tax=uncultured Aquimarina sp. TaxID=575652 RepID=UPI00262BF75A|nr:DUF1501 domain-containing protein [uncultured Aquimarina sp.]